MGVTTSGERVASGIYFYHLTAGDYSAVREDGNREVATPALSDKETAINKP